MRRGYCLKKETPDYNVALIRGWAMQYSLTLHEKINKQEGGDHFDKVFNDAKKISNWLENRSDCTIESINLKR